MVMLFSTDVAENKEGTVEDMHQMEVHEAEVGRLLHMEKSSFM